MGEVYISSWLLSTFLQKADRISALIKSSTTPTEKTPLAFRLIFVYGGGMMGQALLTKILPYRVVKTALTGVFILALFIFCLFIYRAVSDDAFRTKVTDTILANLSGIIFFMLALIGFNVNSKKQG